MLSLLQEETKAVGKMDSAIGVLRFPMVYHVIFHSHTTGACTCKLLL